MISIELGDIYPEKRPYLAISAFAYYPVMPQAFFSTTRVVSSASGEPLV
jgi:hypothetical protein